jgi:uncharacterized membrane protein
MESLLHLLQQLDLHPIVDHFTIGLLVIAVLTDLVASLLPARAWIRYMALTLMILGAIAAGASYGTGDIEADRVWKSLGNEAKQVLHRHAELGEYLAITFAVLAVWRILVESFSFMSGTRPIYLIVAVIAIGVLTYTGHLGGDLVYDYGVGTALLKPAPSPAAAPSPALENVAPKSLPTVPAPSASPTSPAPKAEAPSEPDKSPEPAPSPNAGGSPQPSAVPTSAGV